MPHERCFSEGIPTLAEYHDRIWEVGEDQRNPYQRDRDRILYSSAFQRLGGVTQVVSPSEGHTFHNRLTHSLKVAQVARRLAERLRKESPRVSDAHGDINADVVEAAALAHDLGHPPFGHVAEKELDRLIRETAFLEDGYEGNAQSFRVVTKLCVRKNWARFAQNVQSIEHRRGEFGLNLTRATLNAVLKYPWQWSPDGKAARKWGVYDTEQQVFRWARELPPTGTSQSIEAAIMDWADDIAYSIHDIEDFYRAGLIPLDRLATDQDERISFLEAVFRRFERERRPKTSDERRLLSEAFHNFFAFAPITEPYSGTAAQRMSLRAFSSEKIAELVTNTQLNLDPEKPLDVPSRLRDQVEIVKQLVWHYVILSPALATQQHGYVTVVRGLFETYMNASNGGPSSWRIIPPRFRQVLEDWREDYGTDMPRARLVRNVADTIASFTDSEAIAVYKRISGTASGSVLDTLPT